jgi:sugar phosphate isomerase/epimerase
MKKLLLLLLLFSFSKIQAQEIGIIMGTARQMMNPNPEEGLKQLKAMGIKYLEGAGSRGMSRVEYKKLLDKYGFEVIASGVAFEKIENADSIKTIIENLKFYGAKYAVCYWIPHKGDDFTFEDMKKGVEVFNRAGKQFAESGISLLYHAHGYEFRPYPGTGTMYDYFMENTDPRYVNVEMDVFWMRNPGQNPAALMRKYPNRIPVTHLKDRMHGSIDNLNGRQDKERNVVLGQGDVNIAEVMKAAKEIGVKYHFIEDESSRAAVQLPMHLAYLRGLEFDTKAIEMSVNSLNKATLSADSVALRYLTCEELTYGHSGGTIENKAQFINAITAKKSVYTKIDISNQDITIKGNTAWVRHRAVINLTDAAGKPVNLDLKVLQVWIKENEVWKLFGRQAVR